MVAERYVCLVGALLFVDMTAAAVRRAADCKDVYWLEMLSVVNDGCCQGASLAVWARLTLGCEDDSAPLFDAHALP